MLAMTRVEIIAVFMLVFCARLFWADLVLWKKQGTMHWRLQDQSQSFTMCWETGRRQLALSASLSFSMKPPSTLNMQFSTDVNVKGQLRDQHQGHEPREPQAPSCLS